MSDDFFKKAADLLGSAFVLKDEPLQKHTTFRIGGPAKYFLMPRGIEGVKDAVSLCRKEKIPFTVIGNGSNLLVSDRGYDGAVIRIGDNLNEIRTDGERIFAQAGATLAALAKEALRSSLTGLEFAAGIPGTLGGGLVMNAGAYDGEMKQVVESAELLDDSGNIISLTNEELELGYRTSVIGRKSYYALSAVLKLEKTADTEKIRLRMSELALKRREKQPLEYPSAGSTFKRPEGYFAGRLIMDAGLRGYSVGGACISEKHCGFVINKGGATAADVLAVIEHTKAVVKEKFGVRLEPEVKFLGFTGDCN